MTYINTKTMEELEELFVFSPPSSIRQSLQEAFFSYLLHHKQVLPVNHEKIIEDFYFLINFLEGVESKQEPGSGKKRVVK